MVSLVQASGMSAEVVPVPLEIRTLAGASKARTSYQPQYCCTNSVESQVAPPSKLAWGSTPNCPFHGL